VSERKRLAAELRGVEREEPGECFGDAR